jgi:hypothetical protein
MAIEIALAIEQEASVALRHVLPDLADITAIGARIRCNAHFDDAGWFAIRVVFDRRQAISSGPTMEASDVEFVKQKIGGVLPNNLDQVSLLLGCDWVAPDRFTYVGPFEDRRVSWPHLAGFLVSWLTAHVVPNALEINRQRVLRAVPSPPAYNLAAIYEAIWVLECESNSSQGSAFFLEGVGLVTCDHCLGPETMAFRFDDPGRKFAIKVMKRHAIIDLAVLGIETTSGRLAKGNPSSMNAMDHLLVVGHPNYRIGDSPMSVPGLIVGFRTKSGIRRIITNAPIVAGASGGPVLNAFGDVIGIAVTGSDKFATSAETEDQSIIPSDAIDLL